jgi:hypothetical protein
VNHKSSRTEATCGAEDPVILTAYISGQSLEVRRQWEDISKNEEVKTASQKFSLWQTTLQN